MFSDDVLRSHILTRLDGSSLATLSCTCSLLHSMSSEESLWKSKCSDTWPSIVNLRVQSIVSTFPSGYRSFFSDSFSSLADGERSPSAVDTAEIISAVDIFYKGELIFSKVHETETLSKWFLCSPLRFDLVEPKESIPTGVLLIDQPEGDAWIRDLEENLSLSWIVIDPTGKRSADISSRKPVSVERHWLTGEVNIRFSSIFGVGEEQVEFMVTVVLAETGREIKEVSLVVEDMEGKNVGGRGSLVILAAAMREKRRRRRAEEGKEKYREFMNMKKVKKEMKLRPEKDTAVWTTVCFVAVLLLGFVLCFYLFLHKIMMGVLKKLVR